MNRVRVFSVLVGLAIILWGVGCMQSTKRIPNQPPPAVKARIDALIDSALQLKESKAEFVPYEAYKQAILISIDLWETYAICVVDREELIQLAAIDRAELQGKLNEETARADKNAKWIVYTTVGGVVLAVISFVVGAVAF